MTFNKQLGKNIAALLLLVAFALPATIQFAHLFEKHEHVVCHDRTTHVHKSEIKCDICHFNFSTYTNDIVAYTDVSSTNIPVKNEPNFSSLLFHTFTVTNTRLRAPPVFS